MKNIPQKIVLSTRVILLMVIWGGYIQAQGNTGGIPTSATANKSIAKKAKDTLTSLTAAFLKNETILKETDIVTNLLRVYNHTQLPVEFELKVSAPYDWTDLNNEKARYKVEPGDSLCIPVNIIPPVEIKGGAEYVINALLLSKNNVLMTTAYFFTHTPKLTKWKLSILPQNRIYFKNHQDTASFQVNVSNEGNQTEDILTTLKNPLSQGLITNSAGRIATTDYYDLQVKPQQDTCVPFKIKYTPEQPNLHSIDLDNYFVGNDKQPRDLSVSVTSQDADKKDSTHFGSAQKITFIKLPDEVETNPYSSEIFPLTVDMNTYDIFGIQPMMNLNLYGNALLDNQAHLFYSANTEYSSYYWQSNFLRSSAFYAGYFDKKGDDIQVGNVGTPYSYGVSVGGLGVRGDYYILPQNSIGAAVSSNEYYGGDATGFSVWDRLKFPKWIPLLNNELFTTSVSSIMDPKQNFNGYSISEAGGLNFSKTQHINFIVSDIIKNYYGVNPLIFHGGVFNIGYNGSFFHQSISINDYFSRGSYDTTASSKNLTSLSNFDMFRLSKKWSIQLSNSYSSYQTPYYSTTPITFALSNTLSLSHAQNILGAFSPFLFYNYSGEENVFLTYAGVGGRYSYYNYYSNLIIQAGVQGGYNHLANYFPPEKDYFTMNPNFMLRYRTFSLVSYYVYGPTGIPFPSAFTSEYPQQLLVTLHYQYQFLHKHFVIDNAFDYNYFNQNENSSVSYNPTLYYFSTSGWRFKIGLQYSFSSSSIMQNLYSIYDATTPTPNLENNNGPVVTSSSNIYLNFGVKKTFGIPIPKSWTKHQYKNVVFMAFLDVKGNRKKDPNEAAVENIVVRLVSKMQTVYEVLTNEKGEGRMLNLAVGTYYFSALPLRDMSGWFLNIPDTINIGAKDTVYVPFSRGVKLSGAVIYHPGLYSVITHIDLSHIQVTATDSSGKAYTALTNSTGEFMIYVPTNKYTLTMSEDWMDGNFTVAQNNIPLPLTNGVESIYQSFYVSEKHTESEVKQFTQPAASKDESGSTAYFSIIIGNYPKKEAADDIISQYKKKNVYLTIVGKTSAGLYTVGYGKFSTQSAATTEQSKFQKKYNLKGTSIKKIQSK